MDALAAFGDVKPHERLEIPSIQLLLLDEDFQVRRFRQQVGMFMANEHTSHVLAMHNRTVRIKARSGDDSCDGVVERGTFSLIPANAPSFACWNDPLDLTNIWLSPQFCARVLETPQLDVIPNFAVRHSSIDHLTKLLLSSIENGEPFGRIYREGVLTSIVACLAGLGQKPIKTERSHSLSPLRLRRVLDLIENHLADDLPLARLALEAGITQRHFCTTFGLAMGQPPHRYVIKRRLERASSLLRTAPSMSVTDIAMSLGFNSSSHFATMFRKSFGVSPTEYRHGN